MIDQVKDYVQYELNNISRGFDAKLALERAYGAVKFVLYCDYNSELCEWWDLMLPKFEEAITKEAITKQERRKSKAWKKNRGD